MEFDSWSTPFENGRVWLVDLSWGTKEWALEKTNGVKFLINGEEKHKKYKLIARVFHEDSQTIFELFFESVNGFRCLDEHGLTEIWSSNRPHLNTFKLKGHAWHKESPLTFFMGNDGEWSYLLVTSDECLEVVCSEMPVIKEFGKVEVST